MELAAEFGETPAVGERVFRGLQLLLQARRPSGGSVGPRGTQHMSLITATERTEVEA